MKAYIFILVALMWVGALIWSLLTGGYVFGVELPNSTPHWLVAITAATVFSLVEFGWLVPLAAGIFLLTKRG